MNAIALMKKIEPLASAVVTDHRWKNDSLSVAILGMLLYGYALAIGRMALFLDVEQIDEAVLLCIVNTVGAAEKWSTGLVADANASAFNKSHHPGNFELIGTGHSYFGVEDQAMIIDNVFANIESFGG